MLEDLRSHGVDIQSTGGETADVGDLVRTIIVDSTVVARMKRSDVISNANIQAGDVIVGLAFLVKLLMKIPIMVAWAVMVYLLVTMCFASS